MNQQTVEFRPGTSGPTYKVSSPEELGRLGFRVSSEYVASLWGTEAVKTYLTSLIARASLSERTAMEGGREGLGLTTDCLYQ